jgi:hypothetical protein
MLSCGAVSTEAAVARLGRVENSKNAATAFITFTLINIVLYLSGILLTRHQRGWLLPWPLDLVHCMSRLEAFLSLGTSGLLNIDAIILADFSV